MIKTAGRFVTGLAATAILASCSSSSDPDQPAGSTVAASTTAATTAAANPTPSSTPAPDAEAIVRAFAAAGLPVPNPRDNSAKASCTDLGCTQLITTDAVSVYVFGDESAARRYAEALGPEGAHQDGTVVLGYAAARTPAADQTRYEQVLATTLGG